MVTAFSKDTPRPNGVLFEERFRLRILAQRSRFSGCTFCHKKDRTSKSDEEFETAFKRWQAEEDRAIEPLGDWWHQLREIVITHEEHELQLTTQRSYDLCTERICQQIQSWLILFNWKSLAKHVLVPIIYRFILLACLLTAWSLALVFAITPELPLIVRVPASIDVCFMTLIAIHEVFAIYSFCKPRQIRGTFRTFFRMANLVSVVCIFAHLICAIIIASAILKWEDRGALALLYIVMAFGNDFYHYLMGILFYINIIFFYVGTFLEAIVRCRLCRYCRKYPATILKYTMEEPTKACTTNGNSTCNVCQSRMINGEDIVQLGCNPDHIFHLVCIQDCASTDT